MSGGSESTVSGRTPRRVLLDKIASSTMLGNVKSRVDLGSEIPARAGTVIAGRVLTAKSSYNTLEDIHGRMRLVMPGDIVCGALGHRDALHGYVGEVPSEVKPGDTLNILNLGGVIGRCTSFNPDVGPPFDIEVLGSVLHYPTFGQREPIPLVIEQSPEISDPSMPANLPPIIVVLGTAMNAGKTTVVCEVLRQFRRKGLKAAAAKCTGVSLQRDTLEMRDFGAVSTMSFMHLGVVTTSRPVSAGVTRAIIRRLAAERPEVILLELGDGVLGTYGVHEICTAPDLAEAFTAIVLCATDPVSAWGGVRLLDERFKMRPCVVTGPVSDNRGGTRPVEDEFGLPAYNARRNGEQLANCILDACGMSKHTS